jgi:hypothetical protein
MEGRQIAQPRFSMIVGLIDQTRAESQYSACSQSYDGMIQSVKASQRAMIWVVA